jgi:uncharacterized metal-binding protein YceD (DUF177 family)
MVNPLLERAPPEEFARRGQLIEKEEKLELFPRLSEVVKAGLRTSANDTPPDKWRQAPVAIRLAFGWADTELELPVLKGQVAARVPAVCQRCLEPFELVLEADMKLLFRGPGRRTDSSPDYEVWELDEPSIRPLDVVDEALVMVVPFAALHESEDACGPLAAKSSLETKTEVRPFADLKSQLRRKE